MSTQTKDVASDAAVEDVNERAAAEAVRNDYVHPATAKLFAAYPWLKQVPLFAEVAAAYGPRFTVSLGLCYALSKGASSNFINLSRQPMFVHHYGLNAARYQRLSSMYGYGWTLKPFIASFTDVIAIFGYTKRWYMAVSAVLGTVFTLAYAFLPAKESSANSAAAFIFLACMCKANIDVLSEGHFSRAMRQKPMSGPAVVSWSWGMTFAGTLIGACMMGPLSDAGLTYVGLIVSAGLQFVTFFFFMFNMYGEKKNRTNRRMDALLEHEAQKRLALRLPDKQVEYLVVESVREDGESKTGELMADPVASGDGHEGDDEMEEPDITSYLNDMVEINVSVARENWKLIAYTIAMTCCIITIVCVTVLGTRRQLLYTDIVVALIFIGGAFITLPMVVAKASVFIYFNSLLYLQIPGALANFYVAKPDCVPNGPHFSYTFYQTVGALISDVGCVVGAVLFNRYFTKHYYVNVFIVTAFLQVVGSIFDLIMVERWNLYFHIPDHAMYIFGDAIVYHLVYIIALMPAQILISRLCPRGTETISFALLAGFTNLGTSMAVSVGSLLMESVWPVSTRVPCDFSNTKWLIITGHFVTPLFVIPLAFLLLPHARICDRVDFEGNVICENNDNNLSTSQTPTSTVATPVATSTLSATKEEGERKREDDLLG